MGEASERGVHGYQNFYSLKAPVIIPTHTKKWLHINAGVIWFGDA
jgi:hypothetical protein